jgi:hypothetical protein
MKMKDAFGDALQKIACAAHKPSSPAEFPLVENIAQEVSVPESIWIAPPSITIIEESRAVNNSPREIPKAVSTNVAVEHPVDVTAPGSEELPVAQSTLPRPVEERRSPLTFLLDHRRQTAAVVVLICITAIWTDDGTSHSLFTSSNRQSSQSDSSSVSDAESLLSDFDAVQIQPLREPADPVEPSPADPFPFSIPAEESEASVTSDPAASNVSQATNQMPPATTPATRKEASSEQSPFSPVSSSASHAVRFTGQIEPLQ